jgi:hypothetical protein
MQPLVLGNQVETMFLWVSQLVHPRVEIKGQVGMSNGKNNFHPRVRWRVGHAPQQRVKGMLFS